MNAAVELLHERLARPPIVAGDPGYPESSSPWNRAVPQRPLAVVYPQSVAEIAEVVRAAAAAGVAVTVQPRGHGANGPLDACILIRPDAFTEVTIDAASRSARVGAGVVWGDVLAALDGTGLIALGGSNPEVSVVGYSLGGGHSAFSRSFGLASGSITAIELVDADGNAKRVTTQSDPELFWGLRGGGGHFGVVTAIEFELFSAAALYGGKLTFPDGVAEAVFGATVAVMESAPDQLSLYPGMMAFPDLPFIPEAIRGSTVVTVDVVYVGDSDGAEALIGPLRAAGPVVADTVGAFTIGHLGEVSAEPTEPVAIHDWSTMIDVLDSSLCERLVAAFREAAPRGASLLQLRPLGGALDRDDGAGGAAGASGHAALLFSNAVILKPTMAANISASLQPLRDATVGYAARGNIPTFLTRGADLGDAFDAAVLARLRALKDRVDPGCLFRSNRPFPLV